MRWDHRDSFVNQLIVDWNRQEMTGCSSSLNQILLAGVYTINVWESMDDSDCHGKEQPCHFSRYFYQEWLARCKIVKPELLRKDERSGGGLMKEF